MKNIWTRHNMTIVLSLILILGSCKKESHKFSEKLNNKISNLKKASSTDLVRLSPIKWDKNNEPIFYNLEGKELSRETFQNYLQTQEFEQLFYFDNSQNVKAVVLKPLSKKNIELTKKAKKESFSIGEMAPYFEALDINGNKISIKELKSKVIVINFWFIKCPPCRKETPDLNRLVERFSNEEVFFVSITDDDFNEMIEFFKKQDFNFNHISSKSLYKTYGIHSFPTSIIINKESKVIFNESGGRDDIYEILESEIEKALL